MNSRAFTLIELLVVISIISLMSSIVLSSLQTARQKAQIAKSAEIVHTVVNAINLYYDDHDKWPGRASDGLMDITNKSGQGWPQLYSMLQPYMKDVSPDYPFIQNSQYVLQGLMYMKGTEATPQQEPMWDGLTGAYLGCVKVYEGYYFSAILNVPQSKVTKYDGGLDPDSTDHYEGHVYMDPSISLSSCPVSSVTY